MIRILVALVLTVGLHAQIINNRSGGSGSVAANIPRLGAAAVGFSATPNFDCASPVTTGVFSMTLTGNVTGPTMDANCATETLLQFQLTQDATGGRTFSWMTGFSNACPIDPSPNALTVETFYWNGTTAYLVGCSTTGNNPMLAPASQPAGFIQAYTTDGTGVAGRGVKLKAGSDNTITAMADNDTIGVGICFFCPASGTALVVVGPGTVTCTFTNATTVGHYVQWASGASNGGKCSDAGATLPYGNGDVLGVVTTAGAAGSRNFEFHTQTIGHTGRIFCAFAGVPITTGTTCYIPDIAACQIVGYAVDSDVAETITWKVWRLAAGGTARPTVANSINTSGITTTDKHTQSSTVSDFTDVTLDEFDSIAVNITAVTAANSITVELRCNRK